MLAKVTPIQPQPLLGPISMETGKEETFLVVRRWKEFNPHLEDEIINLDLLSADGTLVMFFNMCNDPDWDDVWCAPNGTLAYSILIEGVSDDD